MESIIKYLPLTLFSSFFAKIIWLGNPTVWETAALIGTGIIALAHQYYCNNKTLEEFNSELENIRRLYDLKFEEQDRINKENTSSVASIKIGTGMTTRRAN